MPHSDNRGCPSLFLNFRRAALCHGARPAFHFGDRRCSYAELLQQAETLAAGLVEVCGLDRGERVALLAVNRPEWLSLSLAIQAAAAVEVPQDPALDPQELVRFLADAEVVLAVVDDPARAVALWQHAPQLPRLRRIVIIDQAPATAQALALADVAAGGRRRLAADPDLLLARQQALTADSLAAVIRTSGTTGTPKAVLLSHGNLLHGQLHLPGLIGLRAGDRVLLCLPLWHLYGRLIAFVGLACGATLHFADLERLSQEFRRIRPDFFPAFPIVWEQIHHQLMSVFDGAGPGAALLRSALAVSRCYLRWRDHARGWEVEWPGTPAPGLRPSRVLAALGLPMLLLPHLLAQLLFRATLQRQLGGRLRVAVVGDAPMPMAIEEGLRAIGLRVLQGYGSTEQIVSAMRSPARNVLGTAGQALPLTEFRVVDADHRRLTAGSIGELAVRGPQICLGYLGDDPRNRTGFLVQDGRRYHLTGDLGWLDRHRNLIFVGRTSEAIVQPDGGVVYPEWTENLVLNSRFIERAVLYPRPSGDAGLLVVPDFRQLCNALGPPPGLSAALPALHSPFAWADFIERHAGIFEAWVVSPPAIRLLRGEILHTLGGSTLPARQRPAQFAVAPRPLRVGAELTVTLKLRRAEIHRRLCQVLPQHLLDLPSTAARVPAAAPGYP